jgi:hypothetical protein
MKEFRAMFCALKGATFTPLSLKILQRPATIRLLPTPEPVPCIMNDPLIAV